MKDTTTENALLLPSVEEVAIAFQSKDALEAVIAKIEADCRAEHYTIATRDGRDRIKSQAYKISRSKTALDDVGKGLTEEARKLIDSTNALRKIATTRLDALKDEIRAPLTKWEAAEDARKQAIKDRITAEFGARPLPASSAELRAIQDKAVAVELDESFDEFVAEAAKAKDAFLRNLAGKIQEAAREEEREAELQRLRAAEAARAEEEAARRKSEAEAAAKRAADEALQRKRDDEARAAIDAERAALAAERDALKAEVAAREAEKEAENARLRAELEAMKQRDLPIEAPAEVPEIEPVGDNYEVVAVVQPVRALTAAEEIEAAVLAILRECGNLETAAALIASAIIGGGIPHVEVSE